MHPARGPRAQGDRLRDRASSTTSTSPRPSPTSSSTTPSTGPSREVEAQTSGHGVDGKTIQVTAEKDPAKLPWKELGVDVVLECTGRFTDREGASASTSQAGAKKVLISRAGQERRPHRALRHQPRQLRPGQALHHLQRLVHDQLPDAGGEGAVESFGIENGLMTTIHSYTNDQRILDLPHKDLRRARAAALSMIPTTTGAAKAVAEVIPEMKGKLNGLVRPGAHAEREPGRPDRRPCRSRPPWRRSTRPSRRPPRARSRASSSTARARPSASTINGNPHSAIFDATSTFVIDGTW